ncbi:MAG: hypothetical protein GSR76_04355 [Desulfurococcales archaeon]|nr:hypothetical protein [Desulfurococcales archaeon]
MKYRLIAILLLGAMLLQPLVLHSTPAVAGSHVYMTAEIGGTSSKVHIDADTLANLAVKMGAPSIPKGSNYTMNIYFDEREFQANGVIYTQGAISNAVPGGQATLQLPSIGNFSLDMNLHITYKDNTTHVTGSGNAVFDVNSNQTGGHYNVDINLNSLYKPDMAAVNVNLVIAHTYQAQPTGSIPQTGMNPPAGSPEVTVTGHTYVTIQSTTTREDNKSITHTHTTIVTDDSADWMLILGIAMMEKYQGANVTLPPQGDLPVTGQHNVTITIDKTSKLLIHNLSNPGETFYIMNQTKPGPFQGDVHLTVQQEGKEYKITFQASGTGDFSNGIRNPVLGLTVTYANLHIEGATSSGYRHTIVKGDIKVKQEDPTVVFLGIKDAMMKAYRESSEKHDILYQFHAASSDIKFVLGGKEYTQVTFTERNITLLPKLGLEYNGTVVKGGQGALEYVVMKHVSKALITIPSTANTTRIHVKAGEATSVVIHPKGGLHASKDMYINITVAGNHQVVMELQPGTDVTGNINVTVIKNPSSIQGLPSGFKPAGPAYTVNANVKGEVKLGVKVDNGNLDNVVVIWIHGTGSSSKVKILKPVEVDKENKIVYVVVPGFSTFIPVVQEEQATTATTSQQASSNVEATTTTSISTKTENTPSVSEASATTTLTCVTCSSSVSQIEPTTSPATGTYSEASTVPEEQSPNSSGGSGGSTGVMAGVIVLLVLIVLAGFLLAKR